jgi:hypothetical protein
MREAERAPVKICDANGIIKMTISCPIDRRPIPVEGAETAMGPGDRMSWKRHVREFVDEHFEVVCVGGLLLLFSTIAFFGPPPPPSKPKPVTLSPAEHKLIEDDFRRALRDASTK